MLVIKNYIFPCIFCTIVLCSDLVAAQGQSDGEITYDGPPFVMIGSSFNITCRVLGDLEWHMDGKPINAIRPNGYVEPKQRKQDGYTISTLTVSEVKESHAGAYKCNSNSNRIININVIRPQALAQPDENRKTEVGALDEVVLTEGQELKLECNLSTEKNFNWQFDGKPINLTLETNADKKSKYLHPKEGTHILKIKRANATTDPGVYRCIAVTEVYKDEFRDIQVYAHPAIAKLPASLNKVEGDSVTVMCKAAGRPDPSIWWRRKSGPLDETERIHTENGTLNATLEIKNLESEDRDEYMCVAENKYSSVNFTVLIRVKDKLAALWPFLGICAEVAILCTIIFIYEKRRSKEEQEEEDPNREEKTVSNSNQKDKDIRQRK